MKSKRHVGLILLSAVLASIVTSVTQDKAALYEKYPQLLSAETDPCVRGLNQLFINMRTQAIQEVMVLSTMHALNDLGSKAGCEHGTIGDSAAYSALRLNVTDIPVSLISGLCLPAECTQGDLSSFTDSLTNKINALLLKAQAQYDLIDLAKGYGLVKDYTRLTVSLTKSDEASQEWRA